METDVLKELMQYKNCIVATGGGAPPSSDLRGAPPVLRQRASLIVPIVRAGVPTRRENWGFMQQGVVVWLDGQPEVLARRVVKDGSSKRPLVASQEGASEYDQVLAKLQGLLEKRREQYAVADVRVTLDADEERDRETGAPAGVVAYRVLEGLEAKIRMDAEAREAKKNFKIEYKSQLPGTMRVVSSPVSNINVVRGHGRSSSIVFGARLFTGSSFFAVLNLMGTTCCRCLMPSRP